MKAGLRTDETFAFKYTDTKSDAQVDLTNISISVTNYNYEVEIEDAKRNIFLLKPRYLSVVRDDLEEMMTYRKGSTQYESETLKVADNIRIYS